MLIAGALALGVAAPNPVSAHLDDGVTDKIDRDDRIAAPIACPIIGPSQFIDSWGDARSGGRRHQGVDMAANRGTPIVAVVAGEARFKRSNLGGNAVWLTTPDGDRYYYAHLDSFQGESRTVGRGEVIGYVGSSGNAGGPHLHFEQHPNGNPANPYPAVFSACVRATDTVSFAGRGVMALTNTATPKPDRVR